MRRVNLVFPEDLAVVLDRVVWECLAFESPDRETSPLGILRPDRNASKPRCHSNRHHKKHPPGLDRTPDQLQVTVLVLDLCGLPWARNERSVVDLLRLRGCEPRREVMEGERLRCWNNEEMPARVSVWKLSDIRILTGFGLVLDIFAPSSSSTSSSE